MVKFTSIIVAAAATVAGVQAQFTTPCNAPYDVCGWTLTNSVYGYGQEVLEAAATAAGQDATNSSILYDAIYNCGANGVIAWNRHCARGCNAAMEVPNANCRA